MNVLGEEKYIIVMGIKQASKPESIAQKIAD
jgi:hypothetical protein